MLYGFFVRVSSYFLQVMVMAILVPFFFYSLSSALRRPPKGEGTVKCEIEAAPFAAANRPGPLRLPA